jgi:hypothetical protein
VRSSHHEAAVIVRANAAAAPEARASEAVTVLVTAVTKRNTAGSMTPLRSGTLAGLQARFDLLNPTGFAGWAILNPCYICRCLQRPVKTVFCR